MFPDFPPQQPPPSPPPQPGTSGLPGQIDPAELTGATYDPELFLRTVVTPAEPYVGQQVSTTIYIYTTLQLSNVNVTREASTDGFWAEDLTGPMRRIEFEDQFVGQSRFRVAILRRMALFPLREGALTIGPAQLEAVPAFRSIFSPRAGTVERQGVPFEVRVRPLPEKGRPADFQPSNVGRYTITSSVDRNEVKAGEPVTLTITVSGEGRISSVKLPPFPRIEGTRSYEPTVDDAVTTDGGVLGGRRTWEVLILPQKTGDLEIPAVELSAFDPVAERYETGRTQPIKIRVTSAALPDGSAGEPDADGTGAGPDDLAPLRSIRRQSELSTTTERLYARPWFLAALAVAPLGFLALAVIEGLRRRRYAARDVLRSRRAAHVALRLLRRVPGAPASEGLVLVARALHGFCADRFGEPVSGLTRGELEAFLVERGVAAELSGRVSGLLELCEQARYGGGAREEMATELAGDAVELVRELDKMTVEARPNGAGRRIAGVVAVALALWPSAARAEDLERIFRQGNEAIWSGHLDEAVRQYESLIELGVWDGDVFYNLGTAYARQGRFGPAILNLERALVLAPGDADARHNLQTVRRVYARQRTAAGEDADLAPPRSFWLNLLDRVTPGLVGISFLACWIGLFVVLGWRRVSAGELTRSVLLISALVLGGSALVSGSLLLSKVVYDTEVREAIAVREGRATLHAGPGERFDPAFEASEGDRLRVLDREGDWLHLRDPGGHEGWGLRRDFGELRRPPDDSARQASLLP
jgi:tetratricopeptide (TPR) repeat protein